MRVFLVCATGGVFSSLAIISTMELSASSWRVEAFEVPSSLFLKNSRLIGVTSLRLLP